MHWPDPAQRHRVAEIRDNLIARIAEAEHEGWLGEAEGPKFNEEIHAGMPNEVLERRLEPAWILPPAP